MGPRAGLRERKKARTRAAIQDHALRLFRDHGYDATTIEQIAEAADVSPSTFFRYFPTKEAVVLYDPFDPRIADAVRAQPQELSAVEAIRRAMRATFAEIPDDERDRQRVRESLLRTVPELRVRMLDEFVRTMDPVAELVAARARRSADDTVVRTLAAAIIGVSISAWLDRGEASHSDDYLATVDEGLRQLETGFRL
jgi:AcrR family transcriptional regulator